jgi:hypothetical protein
MVRESHFTDLEYADDIALPSSYQDDLVACVDSFATSSKKMVLNVSWTKSKVQCLGANQPLALCIYKGKWWNLSTNFDTLVPYKMYQAGAVLT